MLVDDSEYTLDFLRDSILLQLDGELLQLPASLSWSMRLRALSARDLTAAQLPYLISSEPLPPPTRQLATLPPARCRCCST